MRLSCLWLWILCKPSIILQQPTILLLKDGTDQSQGKGQLISNINACVAIVETIKTTLGPRGMDKMVIAGNSVTISNDGATVMKLLDIVHPAAKTLVDIAKSQDAEGKEWDCFLHRVWCIVKTCIVPATVCGVICVWILCYIWFVIYYSINDCNNQFNQ